jgi:hypothetical protein
MSMDRMRKDVIEAYVFLRKNNQSIPDEVLDFMKEASLEKITFIENLENVRKEFDKSQTDYDRTLNLLMQKVFHAQDLDSETLSSAAQSISEGNTIWLAVELGRCPSTDRRTYILHLYYDKPEFDYYGSEMINKKILQEIEDIG